MHGKNFIGVGVLAGSLLLAEAAETTDWPGRSGQSASAMLTTPLPAVPDSPHTHVEAEEQFVDVSNPLFASGGQHIVGGYELMLQPHFVGDEGQTVLAWVDAVGYPDALSGEQRMYGRFQNLDELSSALARIPEYFSAASIQSIRDAASNGLTKVGGSRAPIRFYFSETQLMNLGMSFRSLDG